MRFDHSAPIFLSLGSNLGDRESGIQQALEMLGGRGVSVTAVSSFFLTEPVGDIDQPDFINAACRVETSLRPGELLGVCHEVEAELGRRHRRRWGPREIDIDLLFYGSVILQSLELTLPHPKLWQRRFVLAPLAEIAPDFRDPCTGKTVSRLLRECRDQTRVSKIEG